MSRSLKWAVPKDTIPAWVAEMDFEPAPGIVAELGRAVREESLGYPPPALYARLRTAFHNHIYQRYGWRVPADHCLIFVDVLRVYLCLLSALPKAATVGIISPSYAPLRELPASLGHTVAEVDMLPDGHLPLERVEVAFARRPDLFVLVNPHNPTGKVYTAAELRAISRLSCEYDVPLFVDEVYEPMAPIGKHVPFGMVAGGARHVSVYSAGKAWNISGLRCCQVVTNGDTTITGIERAIGGGASTLGVAASAAAYETGGAWLDDVRSVVDGNARMASERLSVPPPDVGYLLWLPPGIRAGPDHGVLLSRGAEFGVAWAGWSRLNLACEPATLSAVLDRLTGR